MAEAFSLLCSFFLFTSFNLIASRHAFATQQVMDAKEVVNKKRPDGTAIKIAECSVGDASGTIMFTARNKQGATPSRAFTPSTPHPRPPFWWRLLDAKNIR